MLTAVISILKKYKPSYQVVIEPSKNATYTHIISLGGGLKLPFRFRCIDLNHIAYLIPFSIRRFLMERYGIYMEADIDAILDISGFAYGDQWPSRALRLLCNEIHRYKRKNKRIFILPQALGPFSHSGDRKRVQKYFPSVDLVCPRDTASLKHLTDICGYHDNFVLMPDFTISVVAQPELIPPGIVPPNAFLIIPNSNMLHERNWNTIWRESYIPMVSLLTAIVKKKGWNPVIMNHEGKPDRLLCEEIRRSIDPSIPILQFDDAIQTKSAIAKSVGVFSSRFHGCVSALSLGIPCLSTSWSHKYDSLFDEFGIPEYLLSAQTNEEKLNLLLETFESSEIRSSLLKKSRQLTKKTEQMWAHLLQLLENGCTPEIVL